MSIPCKLPSAIARFIGSNPLVADEVGESPADVYGFTRGNERFFLKTCTALYAPTTYSVLREDVSPTAAQLLQALGEPDASAKRLFFEQLDELF